MFRSKVVVRVDPPFSPSTSPFLLRVLHLDLSRQSSTSSSLSLTLETSCWKLNRELRVACIPQFPQIFVVYQRAQSKSAAQVVKELALSLPISNVGEEEEVESCSLVARAVECRLKSALLESNWRCLGDNCFVHSSFSCNDERRHLHALSVKVQSENDGFIFLVSPDVARFSRFKMKDLVSSKMQQSFNDGKEIILDDYNFSTACSILPSLYEGHVIGLSKLLHSGENLGPFKEVWSFKHGLTLNSGYYINVQSTCGDQAKTKWLPSACVLQGSGLAPAPQTIRSSKAVDVMKSFMKIVEAWDFFDRGLLKVKGVFTHSIGSKLSEWTTGANSMKNFKSVDDTSRDSDEAICGKLSISSDLLSANDFRAPKPALGGSFGKITLEDIEIQKNAPSSSKLVLDDRNSSIQDDASKNSTIEVRLYPSEGVLASTETDNKVDQRRLPVLRSRRKKTDTHKNGSLPNLPKDSFNEDKKHIPSKVNLKNNSQGDISMIMGDGNSQNVRCQKLKCTVSLIQSSKDSRKKTDTENLPDKNDLTGSGKETNMKVLRKRTSNMEENKDDTKQKAINKKVKLQGDPSDITEKVIDFHTRGQLQSLTVADLKSFLSTKKAKVGGKKEELIQRISALLS